MENVCSLIPETLDGVDLDVIGYHRQCYQQFTKNQDRLKQLNNPESSMSNSQYSPRKKSAQKEAKTLFPPECIYCDKIEIKTAGKTERPTKFTLASAWEPIESQAKMLGKTSLARKVRGFVFCGGETPCIVSLGFQK